MSVNILNKQTRELEPIAGVPIGKLNLLETEKAEKTNLTNISITGEINTTGSTITQGTFFYLDNELVRALFDIPNGAGISITENIEYVTVGGLNKLNDDVVTLKDALNDVGTIVNGTIRTGITVSVGTKGHVGTITLPKGKWFVFSMIRADQTTGGQLWFGNTSAGISENLVGFSGSYQQNGFGVFGAKIIEVDVQKDLYALVYNIGPQVINPPMGYITAFRIS